MMKIVIVGSDKIYAIENFYTRHLRDIGATVYHFTGQTKFLDFYQKNLFNKIKFKSGLSGVYRSINKELVELIESTKPDVVLVFKGMEIFAATLKWIRSKGIRTVNYNPDNPFIFSGKGSGNSNVSESIPLFDLYLTYDSEVKQQLESKYQVKSDILPFAFELSEELYHECEKENEVIKTCFIGNPDKNRVKFIKILSERGVQIDLFGHDWGKLVKRPNAQVCGPVYADDAWKVIRRYRVQLNLMRIHNLGSHNMRTFEIPGAGGIQLAPKTIDHEIYFTPGKEIFLYDGVDECVHAIQILLQLEKSKAEQIRLDARKRSIKSKYTYKDRSIQLLQMLADIR